MTFGNFIEVLKKSEDKILESNAEDIQDWSKLKHTKADLEVFLNYNIAEIAFKTLKGEDRTAIVTSNTMMIKLLESKKSAPKEELEEIAKLSSKGIHSKDTLSVDTWNLMEKKMYTIPLKSWQIMNWIAISEKNSLVLNDIIKEKLG